MGVVHSQHSLRNGKIKDDNYNKKHGHKLARMSATEDGNAVVAVCDKFPRRVHKTVP